MKTLNDYELGYEHGFNYGNPRPGLNNYPNNASYCEGFKDGDYARVYMPRRQPAAYAGANDTLQD